MTDTTTGVRPVPASTSAGPHRPGVSSVARTAQSLLARHRALCAVLASYALAAALLPTRLDIVILDDWIYVKQARDFANHLSLHIRDQAAANGVFDTLWGGTFGLVLGPHLWVFRLSSIVLSLIGGIGAYALCRELGVRRNTAAAGAAIVLFNPLAFVLSYSFMTDTHLMNLVILSTWAYVAGLRRGQDGARLVWLGSAFAAAAYLCRPQGALIPVAVAAFYLVTRRIRVNRDGVVLLARIALVPAFTFVAHRLWLTWVNGVPRDQSTFVNQFLDSPERELAKLTAKLVFSQLVYVGLFLVPLTLGVIWALLPTLRRMPRRGLLLFAPFALAIVGSMLWAFRNGWHFPYLHDWFSDVGLGSVRPLTGGRPAIVGGGVLDVLAVVAVASTLLLGFAGIRARLDRSLPRRPEAALVASVLLLTMLGAVPQSILFGFDLDPPAPDRYIVSAIPLGVALGLWAVQRLRVIPWLVTAGLVAMATVAFTGTRDSLELQGAMWHMDEHANVIGVSNHELDGGAAWTRWTTALHGKPVALLPGAASEWWLVDGHTNARYAIALERLPGYDVVARRQVSQWLTKEPMYVYLLKLRGDG